MTDRPLVVITGSSRGIGRGLAEYFLNKGWRVAGCSRSNFDLNNSEYFHSIVNLKESKEVQSWARAIRRQYGKIDALICNAGIIPAPVLLGLTEDNIAQDIVETNFMGAFYVCKAFSRLMTAQKYGRIITLASTAVGIHLEGTAVYAASKSALVEMSRILAKELAGAGVTCNVVAPSIINTESLAMLPDDVRQRSLEKQTIRQPISIDDVARVVEFLAAPENWCITGQVIYLGLAA